MVGQLRSQGPFSRSRERTMETRLVVGLDTLVGLSTGVPAVFVEAVIESSYYFSYIFLVTAFALKHVHNVLKLLVV